MATNPNTNSTFIQGEFNQKIELFINDPANVNNPLTTLLECLPQTEYTNQDIVEITTELNTILSESTFFESKQIYNQTLFLKEQLDIIKCMGEDTTILFGGFVDRAKYFIEIYNQIKNDQTLETDVNQNPNYYNN